MGTQAALNADVSPRLGTYWRLLSPDDTIMLVKRCKMNAKEYVEV